MRFSQKIVAAAALVAASLPFAASAQTTITGAGATLPFPIYAKWADEYKKSTNVAMN